MAAELDDTALRSRVESTAAQAAGEVEEFVDWLRDDLLPRAHGDFRLGRELYERKFGHALKATISPDELERRAAATYDEVRAEMARLARELWPTWVGDDPMPDDPDALTRRVLDAIGQDHPKATELLDFCREEHRHIEDFIRERDLIGLADEPLADHLDPAVPASLRRRDAHPARAAGQGPRQLLRDHAGPRRLDR